MVVRSKVSITN